MASISEQLANVTVLNQMIVPDLWQQQAVAALRAGQDVVVQAPTGAGKTLIFELWSHQGRNRGQAIYTVPTRALANDKLAEWRAHGWDVGIATGDLAENLEAPILVATLETQKNRLIQGQGPSLLVVDEYQMLRDADRGLNYELTLAMAPPKTQLLLLSGSVANPQDAVKWLARLGRNAVLIRHDVRPVPLEEVSVDALSYHVPSEIRGYWPRFVAKALAEDLGPILIFAPRRQAAEAIAAELARCLPTPNPLSLSPAQKLLAGEHLTKLLKSRIAYHHSGLSYGARAGVIEPLAKAGQLRVVIATMGLAAGINFSLRSVALAGESYRRDYQEQPLQPDEILQMFGRAGRRGIDETGYALITVNEIRMREGYPCHLSRNGSVDWGTLLSIMWAASEQKMDTFAAAVRVQERLFTTKPIFLGVEAALRNPSAACGLKTDTERARHVRHKVREMLNSRAEWEPFPPLSERPLGEVFVMERPPGAAAGESNKSPAQPASPRVPVLRPALTEPLALEKVGAGLLVVVGEDATGKVYGRCLTVADRLHDNRIVLAKWIRRMINWGGRQAPAALWMERIAPLIEQGLARQRLRVVRFETHPDKLLALVSLAEQVIRVPVDSHGVAVWRPIDRQVMPSDCARCPLAAECRELSAATGVALLWRRLGLVTPDGRPTRRGQIASCFSQGDGLAIAAAIEDEAYPLTDLIYDLANLDAGFRFCGDDNRWGGRLVVACQQAYGLGSIPGYLENGAPLRYGAGAEQIVTAIHADPQSKHKWVTDLLGPGDIDRVVIEWRSRLRQVAHARNLEWPRWREFQSLAKTMLNETVSPTITDLPALEYHQTKRLEHRLILRRH